MPSLQLVFAGSPAAAVPSLDALVASGHRIVAVVTREDSPQGRRGILTPTPVADAAERHGIPVIKANRLAGEATELITALGADLGVIVAYGGLVREPLLSAPEHGWINLHFSLLPRWRGAAPVQHAIIAGDEVTGAAVFQLVPELDAGDVFGTLSQPIAQFQTAGHLLEALSQSGAALLTRVVDQIADGTARAEPQTGDVTLAPKLTLPDGKLDFSLEAASIAARVRGVTPEPGAFTELDGARLKILDARIARDAPRLAPGQLALHGKAVHIGTASEPLELVTVHPAGRKAMNAGDWWRGRPADAATQVTA
ncbi:methionyl-tRNA formyltransferase [Glaciihabitans arcticus]|uniref:Methionyl-tRNA formyltransferase n=1 Tax=Glaciihabitans arcticus TaxID=2668039 RepID=A0A4Q9GUA8_9MICO|nr:methionyl-tRNA formyltransferase [Glaciihabitans arcticus]TBN56747.1 methionyl-tRNA formyltransferase [Glaciihabitans arcticus]